MNASPKILTSTFNRFFDSEKSAGALLLAFTLAALLVANSPAGQGFLEFWAMKFLGLTLAHWVNDALMAVFFLLIGLELEREMYVGELSSLRNALLPVFAAAGGMLVPAAIHFALNHGAAAQDGFGIPMATDIAFALGALAILKSRIPPSLKVFIVAFAVIDDLGAIFVIAIFYTAKVSAWHLAGAIAVWGVLIALNRMRVMRLTPYLLGGALMWYLMLRSGVHATLAGVMLAFAIPFSSLTKEEASPSHRLENMLHRPVAFIILPIFALANTGVVVGQAWLDDLAGANSAGIIAGLVAGKPLGVLVLCFVAVACGICRLPEGVKWTHMIGAGMLGGIGFTMSIFITNLAFASSLEAIDSSRIAILLASLVSGLLGILWLRFCCKPPEAGVADFS